MTFVYGSPTCGKTFAIEQLTGLPERRDSEFPTLDEMISAARAAGRCYEDHILLDTDWLFPYAIRRKIDVKTPLDAWTHWRSNYDPEVEQFVIDEFAKLDDPKCVVFTNLHMWEYGVDVPLRYARTPEALKICFKARETIRNRKYGMSANGELPRWVLDYEPPVGSILLPACTHIYPRIVGDLAKISVH